MAEAHHKRMLDGKTYCCVKWVDSCGYVHAEDCQNYWALVVRRVEAERAVDKRPVFRTDPIDPARDLQFSYYDARTDQEVPIKAAPAPSGIAWLAEQAEKRSKLTPEEEADVRAAMDAIHAANQPYGVQYLGMAPANLAAYADYDPRSIGPEQPIHERYAEKLAEKLWAYGVGPAWAEVFEPALLEMAEEIRAEEKAERVRETSARVADYYSNVSCAGGHTGGCWLRNAETVCSKLEQKRAAAQTSTPAVIPVANQCSGCIGATVGHVTGCTNDWNAHIEKLIGGQVGPAKPDQAPGAWSCPRHGRYPAFSKKAFTDEDVAYGCPSCGSKLVRE